MLRSSGLTARANSIWKSTTEDPQFIISWGLVRPAFLLLELESDNITLDSVLYFDRRLGFKEDDKIALPESRHILCIIPLRDLRHIRRIRFDPASTIASFRFEHGIFYFKRSLHLALENRRNNAVARGLPPPQILTIDGSFDIGIAVQPLNDPVASRLSEHFRHVISLGSVGARSITVRPSVGLDPKISIVVPTYNTPVRYLKELVESYRSQKYYASELILTDDGSTDVATIALLNEIEAAQTAIVGRSTQNEGIAKATNRGISRARGTWIGLLDHDDVLAPHALTIVDNAIEEYPDATFFYTDEVIADEELEPLGYHLKPAFDPVLLSGVNYINHFSLFRRARLYAVGLLRSGFEGSQDYDLLLRYLDGLPAATIYHIPYPAYLWRRGSSSFSTQFAKQSIDNARQALHESYQRKGLSISIEAALNSDLHRPRFDLDIKHWPSISVVIPSRDHFELISRVLDDLTLRTDYPNLEIIVVDNGSIDSKVSDLYNQFKAKNSRFKVEHHPGPFNFSTLVNRGIEVASGDAVLLLNNDIEIVASDWLREMVSCLQYPNTGIVGSRLLYPDHTLQHVGVIVGFGRLAAHWFHGKPNAFPGPWGRLYVRQRFSAVTGACMLITKECITRVGLFDASRFAVAYNDVDYCLRAQSMGFHTVWTPFATLIHHESASRGSDEAIQNRERFANEKRELRTRHATATFTDPASSPWYTLDRSDPGLVLLNSLPVARNRT
jgi:O-antigen biosynthesis protein